MRGAYFQFMRIALRLLIGIRSHQLREIKPAPTSQGNTPPPYAEALDSRIAEAQEWLEANK